MNDAPSFIALHSVIQEDLWDEFQDGEKHLDVGADIEGAYINVLLSVSQLGLLAIQTDHS